VRLKSFQTTDGQAAVFAEVGVITNYLFPPALAGG